MSVTLKGGLHARLNNRGAATTTPATITSGTATLLRMAQR